MTNVGSRSLSVIAICITAAVIANAQSTTSVDELLKRIQALEKRVADLEKLGVALVPGGASTPPAPDRKPPTPSPRPSRLQAPVEIVDNGVIIASIERTSAGLPKLTLGDDSRGGVIVGVGLSGNGYIVVNSKDGKPALDLGTGSRRPMGMYVLDPDGLKVQAGLSLDEAGKGRLAVGLPDGARGVLGQPKTGGVSFALFDGPGPKYRVGMLADGSGSLRLNSGKREIELDSSATGGNVTLYNDSGSAVASLDMTTSGHGQFSLSDRAGVMTVQAGTTDEGRGVVRVGPRMGGVVGFEGSMPWALLGKK